MVPRRNLSAPRKRDVVLCESIPAAHACQEISVQSRVALVSEIASAAAPRAEIARRASALHPFALYIANWQARVEPGATRKSAVVRSFLFLARSRRTKLPLTKALIPFILCGSFLRIDLCLGQRSVLSHCASHGELTFTNLVRHWAL